MLKQEEFEKIRGTLAVFSLSRLQELVTLSTILEREGLTLETVRDFLETTRENQRLQQAAFKARADAAKKQWNKNTRGCPTCMMPLVARAITTPKGKANIKGYTCHWYCQEESCGFEEYTHENFKEIYQKIMGRR
jgi:hypothetical protein